MVISCPTPRTLLSERSSAGRPIHFWSVRVETEQPTDTLHVCYLLCYGTPDYTRTASLLNALELVPGIRLDRLVNKRRGVLRYVEMLWRILLYRIRCRPDVWVLGFRGQESFMLFYPFMRGSRIIFDEFVILQNWANEGDRKHSVFLTPLMPVLRRYMRWIINRCDVVLEDSVAHQQAARAIYQVVPEKFVAIPVGADETVFEPVPMHTHTDSPMEVFFYGTMLPLHGLETILQAVKLVLEQQRKRVHFTIVGGSNNKHSLARIESFLSEHKLLSDVTHLPWVPYLELPAYIAKSDVCLGGPFGDTAQAASVITGKTYQFLAMGKPTIVSMLDETDFFQDRVNLLVCQRGEASALAQAILWCLHNRELLPEIGKQGRELFEERFSAPRLAQLLTPLLTGTAGQSDYFSSRT